MSDNKDRRPWVKLDVGYFRNMKVARVSNDAKVLHLTLITLAAEQKTDGVLPVQVCKQMGNKPFKELVDNHLLIRHGSDYEINDYLKHQTPAQVISDKASKGAHIRWHARRGVFDETCQYCTKPVEPERPVDFDTSGDPPF